MVDLKKTTEVKVGDVISFYLFGNLVKGRAYIIKEWNFERGIEIG